MTHFYGALVSWLFLHEPPKPPAETRDGSKAPYKREESQLSLYLWNLSSLGWNLAVALAVVLWLDPAHSLRWVMGVLVLCFVGSDFRVWSVRFGKTGETT
ncbi:hypothetical protein D7X30_19635 [Corallococcus sp. AB011P]|uniref:hypothetical protein n=1 Tax=Corallococcus sp. AB011P TaxID=2316735 RepID=UPI000EA2A18D|nr:hypothetical protein [Corallococcus sp. AB011P]RKG57698.1 hypothetical protein D7X30_19635 [Corallococcus sp. AB011P]